MHIHIQLSKFSLSLIHHYFKEVKRKTKKNYQEERVVLHPYLEAVLVKYYLDIMLG